MNSQRTFRKSFFVTIKLTKVGFKVGFCEDTNETQQHFSTKTNAVYFMTMFIFGGIIPINKGVLFIIFNVVNQCAVVYIVTVNQSLSYLIPMPLVPTKLRKTFFSLISFPPTEAKPATLVFLSWYKTIKTGLNKKQRLKRRMLRDGTLTPDSDTYWSTNCHFRGSSEELIMENL